MHFKDFIKNIYYNKINYKNIILISSSNILQQVFTFFITICILRLYGPSAYGDYVIIIALVNLLIMFTNPSLNPFLIREGSKEFIKKKKISNSISIVIIFNIFLLFVIILSIEIFDDAIKIFKNEFINVIKIILISYFIINLLKILSRISNSFEKYFFINLLEKSLLIVTIIIFYFILSNSSFDQLLITYTSTLLIISFFCFKFFRKNINFNFNIKKSIKNFFRSVVPIYVSTVLFIFVNQHYLIIILNNNNIDKIIIAAIGIGFLMVNMVYFPIYWLEQYLSQFYYNALKTYSEEKIKKYFNEFGLICVFLSILISSIIFLLIVKTPLLYLFDDEIFIFKYLVGLVVIISLSICFDTILAIPIYALKQEKFMMYALIIRLVLFSYFIFNETNYEILVFIFILLNYIQNFILKVLIFFKYNFIDLKYLFLTSLFILILIFYYNDYYFFVEIVVFLLFLYSAIFLYNKKALILNLILDKKL